MKVSLALLAALTPLFGQPFPDAAQLLDRSSNAMQSYRTVQYTSDATTEMTVMGNPIKTTISTRYQSLAPNKLRLEILTAGAASTVLISDGRNSWMYLAPLKQYMKTAGSIADLDQTALGNLAGSLAGDAMELRKSAKVTRGELLEVDGQPHDCWVVESTIPQIKLPAPLGGDMRNGTYTTWLDKRLGLALRTVTTGKMRLGSAAPATDFQSVTIVHSLKFDEDLPESLFVFTPPADAKENASLLSGLALMPPKPSAEPRVEAAKGSPALVAADEPQAFVPSRHPVKQTEPEYPASLREKGVQGMVNLLITLDPTGAVAKAEALSGPKELRKPAEDAVRQWKFRPVIRDGRPVAAFTEAMVRFGEGVLVRSDISDGMAEANRMVELMFRFPRSPQEEFADLEQDWDGFSGPGREFLLPELAHAALKAGALDKAELYAKELLATDPKGFNHGQAVHDGNIVRGVVTLRRGNVAQAVHDLLEAGKTPGSPLLNSSGPKMVLAKELIEKGERDAVIEYFNLCRKFWPMGAAKLDQWTAAVRKGDMPDFGANLLF